MTPAERLAADLLAEAAKHETAARSLDHFANEHYMRAAAFSSSATANRHQARELRKQARQVQAEHGRAAS